MQQIAADDKEQQYGRHADALAVKEQGAPAKQEWAHKRGRLTGKRKEAVKFRLLFLGNEATH